MFSYRATSRDWGQGPRLNPRSWHSECRPTLARVDWLDRPIRAGDRFIRATPCRVSSKANTWLLEPDESGWRTLGPDLPSRGQGDAP